LLLRVRCSARQAVDSVTVDDVVRKVGGRKRTFYVHFKDLPELTAAVVDELVEASDDLLHQSGSQSMTLRSALPSAVVASSIGRWPIPVGLEWRRGWSSCRDEPAVASEGYQLAAPDLFSARIRLRQEVPANQYSCRRRDGGRQLAVRPRGDGGREDRKKSRQRPV
jgi:AcrR family transcriptional regulator